MNAAATGYARALFRAAETRGVLARVSEELALIEGVLGKHSHFLNNPAIPASRKADALHSALNGQADPLTVGFLVRLVKDRRLKLLPHVRRVYDIMASEALGEVTVRLRVRYAPSDKLLTRLRDELSARGLFAREKRDAAVFEVVIDESVIGGFIAEHRGRVVDASLKTKLTRLNAIKA